MTSSFMLQNVKKLLNNQMQGAGTVLVTDYTYKISASGWGLGLFALTQRHASGQGGSLQQTEVILAALCWVPKENTVSIASPMSSFVHLMPRHDIDLLNHIKFVCMDGTDAGKLAASKVLPTLRHQLDLRHVLRAIRDVKLATCGHRSNALRMAAQVRWPGMSPPNLSQPDLSCTNFPFTCKLTSLELTYRDPESSPTQPHPTPTWPGRTWLDLTHSNEA